jgi:hypothetical protein
MAVMAVIPASAWDGRNTRQWTPGRGGQSGRRESCSCQRDCLELWGWSRRRSCTWHPHLHRLTPSPSLPSLRPASPPLTHTHTHPCTHPCCRRRPGHHLLGARLPHVHRGGQEQGRGAAPACARLLRAPVPAIRGVQPAAQGARWGQRQAATCLRRRRAACLATRMRPLWQALWQARWLAGTHAGERARPFAGRLLLRHGGARQRRRPLGARQHVGGHLRGVGRGRRRPRRDQQHGGRSRAAGSPGRRRARSG